MDLGFGGGGGEGRGLLRVGVNRHPVAQSTGPLPANPGFRVCRVTVAVRYRWVPS